MKVICGYCQSEAKLVTGNEVYPHRNDLGQLKFYTCDPCDARVGTHKGSEKPLGSLANEELRKIRWKAHQSFDPLWINGRMTRSRAYEILSLEMKIPSNQCHIGMFDIQQCVQAIRICRGWRPL